MKSFNFKYNLKIFYFIGIKLDNINNMASVFFMFSFMDLDKFFSIGI